MPIVPTVLADATTVGQAVAEYIIGQIVRAAEDGRRFLLGCPSGRTPSPTYSSMARLVKERSIDLSHVVAVIMDEYLRQGPDGIFVRVDPASSYSCVGFADRVIRGQLDDAAQAAGVGGLADVWNPDPADPAAHDRRIEEAGGIDLFILASGASDGHIAFNQPGTPRTTGTHIVELGERTRRDNMNTFPEFTTFDLVPTHGISVGISTIVDQSREVVMILTGADKELAFRRLAAAENYEPDWPATAYAECANAQLFADQAAAAPAAA